jgi:hypothetical protein
MSCSTCFIFGLLAVAGVAIPLHGDMMLDIGIEYSQGFLLLQELSLAQYT